jgi:hypothetical protein
MYLWLCPNVCCPLINDFLPLVSSTAASPIFLSSGHHHQLTFGLPFSVLAGPGAPLTYGVAHWTRSSIGRALEHCRTVPHLHHFFPFSVSSPHHHCGIMTPP